MIFRRFLSVIVLILLSGSGQVLLKKGAMGIDLAGFEFSALSLFSLILSIIKNGWLMAGLFFMGATFLLYLLILSKAQLSIIYPAMVSGTIIFITLVSWPLFQEFLSFWQISGILLVISGIFLIFSQKITQA